MSRIALVSLALTVVLSLLALEWPIASNWAPWCKAAALFAAAVSLCLLVAGKRVKFDPVLR